MKILFVQNGDYAEAYHRLAAGEAETYRDQRRSVDFVADLAKAHEVTVIFLGETEKLEHLTPRLAARSLPQADLSQDRIAALFDEIAPDRFICRAPHLGFLREAGARGIACLPNFADIFTLSLRHMPRNLRLRRALRRARVPCISNHSLNASVSAQRALFWPESRIVPWDWSRVPVEPEAKSAVADPQAPTLFFAGALTESKGVGDCLAALERLHAAGRPARMTFAGGGDIQGWQARAARMGLANAAQFPGLIPHEEVRRQMRAHDAVLVPSRHDYPEGLPNTIYEGLASRSPLILSDHPAFRGRVPVNEACLEFPAGDPAGLARCVDRLCDDPALYSRLSENAEKALDGLYIGLEWEDLVTLFLDDPDDRTGWVTRNALPAWTV